MSALESTAEAPAAERALRSRHAPLARLLMFVSGFAGLGYQVVWTQQGALALGQESAAVLAVVTAFFGGLALGALALGTRIERSARPGHWYAACELLIAGWGAVLLLFHAVASGLLMAVAGPEPAPWLHWALAFGGTFVLLLPATAAMGATLPALAGLQAAWAHRGSAIAGLYAANTLGAVAGVLVTAFWLLPTFGLWRTAATCIALNLVCAAAALALAKPRAPAGHGAARTQPAGRLPWLLAATGLLGIGFEVMVVRLLSQVFENTVYTLALVLAVYLAGTAVGAWAYQRRTVRHGIDASRRDRLLQGLAAAGLISVLIVGSVDEMQAWLRQTLASVVADPLSGALGAEAALAAMVFGLPTMAMGAMFSQLCDEARAAGLGFGRALGWNTLGAAIAPLAIVVLALPLLGSKVVLLGLVVGYLLLLSPQAWRRPVAWVLAGGAATLAAVLPGLVVVSVPPGGRVERHVEGPAATVSVVEDAGGVLSLHINNRQQEGSSATHWADGRQALLPLLLHGQPRQALFLGVGTGITATTAARFPGLSVDAVELIPEVLDLVPLFASEASASAGLRFVAADARRYVRQTAVRYDVVVADNVHPARGGSGALYTVEHFRAVSERLAPNGLFCQWLPLHQMDPQTLRSIVRSFQTVFPQARAVLATHSLVTPVIGLVGGGAPATLPALQAALTHLRAVPAFSDHGLADPWAVLGSHLAGPASLARFAEGAPLNTDDHPVVAHGAPRATYAPEASPAERLLSLMARWSIAPEEVFATATASQDKARLAAYWQARELYLQTGRHASARADVHAMLAQVREPLLAVLRMSADFTPAFDPLMQMAAVLADLDAPAARALLLDLRQVRPGNERIDRLLAALPADPH